MMKRVNLLIAFALLLCFIVPYQVKAVDESMFYNNCEFIPNKAYAVQNNGSHNNGTSFLSISSEDTNNLYTGNAYVIGNSNYRAVKLRDVFFDTSYGSTIQFEFFPHNLDKWGENGKYWNLQSNYEGYVFLGSLKDTKFSLRKTYNNISSSVGVLPSGSYHDTMPSDYNDYVNQHSFYHKNENMQISILHFRFELKGDKAKNHLVLNITSDTNLTEDIYILGFNLKSSSKATTSLGTEGWTNVSREVFDIFRQGFDSECYVGTLPDDIANPDETIECDGVIDCAIKNINSSINKWLDGLLDFFTKLFIPDKEVFSGMATDFMDWFDKKLGFLGQPITFTIDFLNRFLSLKDTGHYLIEVPNIKVPLFNSVIIKGFSYDLASTLEKVELKRIHDVTFIIINGTIVIAFLMLCAKKYTSIFGGSSEPTETLIESDGYTVDEKGVVHSSTSFRHSKSYKKSKITRKWVKK